MAHKRYGITWTQKQNDRLKQAIKTYNKQLAAQAKALPQSLRSYLPPKIKVRDARKEIRTADDLRSYERRLAREVREGLDLITTPKGVVLTRGQYKDLTRRVAKINKERAERRERFQLSDKTGTNNRFYTIALSPKANVDQINIKGWDRFVNSVYNQSAKDYWAREEGNYKQIYLQSIRNGVGNTPAAALITALVQQLPDSVLYEAQYRDPYLQHFFLYPGKDDDPNELSVAVWTHWGNYLDALDADLDWDKIYAKANAAAAAYEEESAQELQEAVQDFDLPGLPEEELLADMTLDQLLEMGIGGADAELDPPRWSINNDGTVVDAAPPSSKKRKRSAKSPTSSQEDAEGPLAHSDRAEGRITPKPPKKKLKKRSDAKKGSS